MICVDREMLTLHKMMEVLDGKVYGQKLMVKSAVLPPCRVELAGEEGNWAPVPSQKLFKLPTNSFV